MTTAQLKTLASEIQDATYLLAIKLSKAIVNLDATDARFYGSKDAYDKLTRYAQRVLRIEADRNNSEINSLATVTAVSAIVNGIFNYIININNIIKLNFILVFISNKK